MLQSNHVTLRAAERDDVERLRELLQHVDLVLLGFGSWEPRSLAKVERFFERMIDSDDPWFMIVVDGVVIGDAGLHTIDQRSRVTSFGMGIYDPAYVGRGYGREALALLLDWAFRIQNFERVWLDTWASNQRAIRAYRAVGFVEEARQRQHTFVNGVYEDAVLMGLLRDEWYASHKGETGA